MGDDKTKFGEYIRWAKDHRIISFLMFAGAVVIAIAAVVTAVIPAINAIRSWGSDEASDPTSVSVQIADTARDSITEPKGLTFTLHGFTDDSLVAAIERETGYKHSRNSQNNRIEITYSGSLTEIDETDMFYYEGGNLKIVIDEHECAVLSSIRIDPSLRSGNRYNALHAWLIDKAQSLASDNATQIAERAKECLQ